MGLPPVRPASWDTLCPLYTREPGFNLRACFAICPVLLLAPGLPSHYADGRTRSESQLADERTPLSRRVFHPGSFVEQIGVDIFRFPRSVKPLFGVDA